MNELLKIGIEFVRKQAGIVIILMAACGGLIWVAVEQKRELVSQMTMNASEYRDALHSVSARLDACEAARSRLIVEIEVMKVQVDVMKGQVESLRRKK